MAGFRYQLPLAVAALAFLAGVLWNPLPRPSAPTMPTTWIQTPLDAVVRPPYQPACEEVERALRRAGWPEREIPTMLRIVRGESWCNRIAERRTATEWSVGAFQINLARGVHDWVPIACARDLNCGAAAALVIYRTQGFRAWASW